MQPYWALKSRTKKRSQVGFRILLEICQDVTILGVFRCLLVLFGVFWYFSVFFCVFLVFLGASWRIPHQIFKQLGVFVGFCWCFLPEDGWCL